VKRAITVALVVCTLGALAWAVRYALELRAAMAPTRPTTYIQAGWSVYRFGPGHASHVGGQNLDCTACHRSTEEGHFDRPGPGGCIDCHASQAKIDHALVHVDHTGHRAKGAPGDEEVSDCMRCHGFGPDPEKTPTDCLSCHARAQGSEPPVTMHADQACGACHDVHENRVTPLDCQQCHTVSVEHKHDGVTGATQCLDCHDAHAPAFEATARCRDCHGATGAAPIPAAATTAGGHTCTGCHTPHGFAKAQVASCEKCHTDQHVLSGSGHSECTSCHAPHDVKKAVSEQNVCVTCHKEVSLSHDSKVDPIAACTGCHAPHPDKPRSGAADCTSCHASVAKNDVSAHMSGIECTQCHAPHAFAQTSQSAHVGLDLGTCRGCHGPRIQQLATHPGHTRCESCHKALPHGGDPKPIACATCHQEQAKATHAGSATGHRDCVQCHDAHTGARIKSCASCHGEQASHLSVKHGPCQSCHEEHSGSFLSGVADCTGCHIKSKLTGLHEIGKHVERCSNCHEVHATDKAASPPRCLGCHQDQKDHQPSATRCDGCHAFRPPPRKGGLP